MIAASDDGRVRTLRFDRPATLNAFDAGGFAELAAALRAADADPAVSVVLLAGAGRAFTSGADRSNWEPANRAEVRRAFVDVVGACAELTKPLLCAVHGVAVGFGGTVLGHADLVFVADDARVQMPFGRLGTVPEAGSTATFPALLGRQRAFWALMGSPWLSGPECVALGLAHASCPAEELEATAMRHAQQLAATPLPVLLAGKRLLTRASRAAVAGAVVQEMAEAEALAGEGGS